MGLSRRAEWDHWHEDPIHDPTVPTRSNFARAIYDTSATGTMNQPSNTSKKSTLVAPTTNSPSVSSPRRTKFALGQSAPQFSQPLTSRFTSSLLGYDSRGIPLVDNKSGLGLGLGLHSGARASLEQYQRERHAEELRYDPSIGKFVQGYGALSQRAAPIYNSTRAHHAHHQTRSGAKKKSQDDTDSGNDHLFGGSIGTIVGGVGVLHSQSSHPSANVSQTARLTTRTGSIESTRPAHLFPRHPADDMPLTRPQPSHPSEQPFRTMTDTASQLIQMKGENIPRILHVQQSSRLPPILRQEPTLP